jgi:hypothetical protein
VMKTKSDWCVDFMACDLAGVWAGGIAVPNEKNPASGPNRTLTLRSARGAGTGVAAPLGEKRRKPPYGTYGAVIPVGALEADRCMRLTT